MNFLLPGQRPTLTAWTSREIHPLAARTEVPDPFHDLLEVTMGTEPPGEPLPEWTNFGELFSLGAVSLISLVYLLPSALLTALSVLPLLGGTASFISVSALISRFIYFGAMLAYVVGLAFSVTALHTYLSSSKIGDLFNFGALFTKIKAKKADLGFLIGLAAIGVVAVTFVNWALGGLGFLIGVVIVTFISLMVSYGSGYILGRATPQLPDTAVEPSTKIETPAAAPVASVVTEEPADVDSSDEEEDRWIPS